MELVIEDGKHWVVDDDNNRCSVEEWGSQEDAERALETLIGCSNCTECSICRYCTGCKNCHRCDTCINCSSCWNCHDMDDSA